MNDSAPHDRRSRVIGLLLAALVVAFVATAWLLFGRADQTDGASPTPQGSREHDRSDSGSRFPGPALNGREVGVISGDSGRPALDCVHPEGNAASIDGAGVAVADLCARLARIGGAGHGSAGPDRVQARRVLDQLIDATLVHRALAWERVSLREDEIASALAALDNHARDGGDDASTPSAFGAVDSALLREQMVERLELRTLASLRHPGEVTEHEVDAEIATGARGIDRGQGVRVEAWIARESPMIDAGANSIAQQSAEAFVLAVQSESPESAAARLRMSHLSPFVVGANGVEAAFEQAAHGLAHGQWSGAIHTRVGWAVLRALGRVEGEELSADVLRARVRQALENLRLQNARQSVMSTLRTAAHIEILVEL